MASISESPVGLGAATSSSPATDDARLGSYSRESIKWDYAVAFAALHLLALLVFVPWFFSWAGVIAFVLGVSIFGQLGIPICYHRLLAHRSFRTPKWFEHTLATLAMCNLQETPVQWVAWHRIHHKHSDHHEDPHSPRTGFLWSHVNWLVYQRRSRMNTYAMYDRYARDLLRDRYYMWLEKLPQASGIFYGIHAVLYFAISLAVCTWIWGWGSQAIQQTLSLFIWGVVARTVWVWHITWSVNSLSHVFGYRNYDTDDDSRNNWLVTLLTAGEGWHNNHHADQASVTVQHRWWELDVNYYVIKFFSMIGLASNLVPPVHHRRAARQSPGSRQEQQTQQ